VINLNDKKNEILAYLCLIGAVSLWGGNWVAVRFVVQEIPPLVVVTARTVLSAMILLLIMNLRKDPRPSFKEYKFYAFLGLVGLFGFNYCQFFGLKFTTATNGSLINAITPMLVILFSHLLIKERLNFVQVLGALISFFGVGWIVTRGSWTLVSSLEFNIGDLLMFIGSVCWAIYTIYSKKPTLQYSAVSVTAFSSVFAAFYFLPFGIAQYQAEPLAAPPSWQVIMAGCFIVTVAVCGIIAWNKGISMIGPSKGSIFMNLMPIFTVIFAFLILKEPISLHQLLGGVFVLIGVLLTTNPQVIWKFKLERSGGKTL
jgi:drug/metabolite transporter (DMT)-like permease